MKLLLSILVSVFALSGCASTSSVDLVRTFVYPPGSILPHEAILRAADAAPRSVYGLFYVQVKASGSENGIIYLNSELDYRDQRNVTVDLMPAAAKALEKQLGESPAKALVGKRLLVRGAARRVKVYFLAGGKPSGKYYFQTHVTVVSTDQIAVQGGG